MKSKEKIKIKFYPFLYLLMFCIILYSINDMATSTNAYQAQGVRTTVYIYLIAILVILGIYLVTRRPLKILPVGKALAFVSLWTIVDNLVLGNLFNENRWASLTQIGLAAWWVLALVFGYYFIKDDDNKEKQLKFFIIVLYFYYCIQFINVAIVSNAAHDQTSVLNLIYRIIVFVPFINLLENKKLKIILLVLTSIFTVVSFKRGAIIVLPIMLYVSYTIDNRENKNSLTLKRIIGFGIIVIAIFALFEIVNHYTNGFLSYRFSAQQMLYGSSRDVKYAAAVSEISQRKLVPLMLGIGSSARSGVHNEILEFLVTYGVIGFILYFGVLISMILRLRTLIKIKSSYAGTYAMIFIFVLVVGLFSGVFFTHSTFYLMLTLGMVESKVAFEKKKAIMI